MKKSLCLIALLLVACGKEEPQAVPLPPPKLTEAPKPPVPEKKPLPVAPQGELERMDPEKAKYIAIPNTPKDPEVKKVDKPATEEKKAPAPAAETKKAEAPAAEIKKAAAPEAETKDGAAPAPEVKKAAPAAQQ